MSVFDGGWIALAPMKQGVVMMKKWVAGILSVINIFSFAQAKEKPNVVFILADDLGYGDVGFTGGPVCTPTRASIMTGNYPQRCGLAQVLFVSNDAHRRSGLPPDDAFTLAQALKGAGYATALLGKWHLGAIPGSQPNKLAGVAGRCAGRGGASTAGALIVNDQSEMVKHR